MINRRQYLTAVGAALSGTGIAFAATSGGTSIDVTPAGDLDGQFAQVTALSGTFSVQRGHAQVINGVELYKIELGKGEWSDEALIDVFLMNGHELGKVLGNQNSYIEVAVWYPGSGTQYVGPNDGTQVTRDPAESALAKMSAQNGAAKLTPSVDGEKTLYILARIMVPGGAPPGQQGKNELKFSINVRRT